MAISMYDQPAQADFMQTYVPIPFDELMQAGAVQQQRWEESDLMTQEAESSLGNIPYLDSVNLASGERLEVGHKKLVQSKIEEFENTLSDLSSSIPDKSSPEYRGAIRKIVKDLRREFGSSGVFGASAAAVEGYREFTRARTDEGINLGNFHRGIQSDQFLRQFAESSTERVSPFNVEANFLADINPHEVLQGSLDKVNDLLLQDANISPDAMYQIRKQGYIKGIDPNRIRNIATSIIRDNHELMTDIQARSVSYGIDPEQLINNYADTMASMYMKQDGSVSWSNMSDRMFDEGGEHSGFVYPSIALGSMSKDNIDRVKRNYTNMRSSLQGLERAQKASERFSNVDIPLQATEISNIFKNNSDPDAVQTYLALLKENRTPGAIFITEKDDGSLAIDDSKFIQGADTGYYSAEDMLADELGNIRLQQGNNINALEMYQSRIDNFINDNELISQIRTVSPDLPIEEMLNIAEEHEIRQAKEHSVAYPMLNTEAKSQMLQYFQSERVRDFYIDTANRARKGRKEFDAFAEAVRENKVTNFNIIPAADDLTSVIQVEYNTKDGLATINLSPEGLPTNVKDSFTSINSFLSDLKDIKVTDGYVNIAGMELRFANLFNPRTKQIDTKLEYRRPGDADFIPTDNYGDIINHTMTSILVPTAYRQRTSEKGQRIN